MKQVALLFDDPQNPYQQLLVREARAAAERHGIALREPEYAGGSSWTQVESINQHLRSPERPDGMLVMLAGSLPMKSAFERVLKNGIAVVMLNRIPDWMDEIGSRNPDVLIAGAAPDQQASGRIQGEQASRLKPEGGCVLLVTGTVTSPTAVERRRGFLETAKNRFVVHEVDGGWSAKGAETALAAWFRVGAERDREPDLVVCQNDAMAAGARAALQRQAVAVNQPKLAHVPLIGCDGLEEEGRAAIRRGELQATVVLPATTPAALETFRRFWVSGERAGVVRLGVTSHPPLDSLRSA